jgi:hypothetical protein
MITRQRINTSLITLTRTSATLLPIPILLTLSLTLMRIPRRRAQRPKVAIISTSIGLIRILLRLRTRRFGKHRLSCCIVHTSHLHLIDISVLLTQRAAVVPTRHGGESIFIVGFGGSVEVCILRFLLLLGAIDRGSGGLILCILRELRDRRRRLSVSLVTAMVVVTTGSAAGEATQTAAAAFKAAAEAAHETPYDGYGYHCSDDNADDYWPPKKVRVSVFELDMIEAGTTYLQYAFVIH